MSQTISCKVMAPTLTKGMRVRATSMQGMKEVEWHPHLNEQANYRHAANSLLRVINDAPQNTATNTVWEILAGSYHHSGKEYVFIIEVANC